MKKDPFLSRLCRFLSFFLILPFPPKGPPHEQHHHHPSGLQYEDTVLGTGAIAKAGQNVKVHYTGWLYNNGVQGAKFDSSKDRGQPFEFCWARARSYAAGTKACRACRWAARAA